MGKLRFVEMLTDKHDFLHAVAIFLIPVARQARFLLHHLRQFVLRCGGIPQAGFRQLFLAACLLKEERHVAVVGKIADALGADHVFRPFC